MKSRNLLFKERGIIMTIKEAVELYNNTNEKITSIKKLAHYLFNPDCIDPFGDIRISEKSALEIGKYLNEYQEILHRSLDEKFPQSEQ